MKMNFASKSVKACQYENVLKVIKKRPIATSLNQQITQSITFNLINGEMWAIKNNYIVSFNRHQFSVTETDFLSTQINHNDTQYGAASEAGGEWLMRNEN